jgi:excisionase family DNA binding protein
VLRSGEAAKQLGVSKNTLLTLIAKGRIKASNVSTSERPQYRIRQEDLDSFQARNTVNSDQGAA